MIFLIVGQYKTGKSISAGTFPKPMLYLDFDGGSKSIFSLPSITEKDKIEVLDFYKDGVHPLTFKTTTQKDRAPEHVKESSKLIEKFNGVMSELEGNPKGYQTLVIDPLSAMFRVWKETIMDMNAIGQLRIADYVTLENVLFGQFIPTIRALKEIPYIVLVDHTDVEKDENTGMLIEYPVGPSRNMGRAMGAEFDEIYLQQVQGNKYQWRTKKSGLFQAGSRLNLPDPIGATFSELSKYIKGK